MSFQDVGLTRSRTGSGSRGPGPRPQHAMGANSEPLPSPEILDTAAEGGSSASSSATNSFDLRWVSVEILKYQKEVGGLPSVLHSAGIIGPSDEWKLKMRFDGVRILGEQISLHLLTCDENLNFVSKNRAADSRAALVKLTRDFRRVEAIFKNLEMEFKKKSADRAKRVNSYQSHMDPNRQIGNDGNARELQLRMEEQDNLNEEIMRLREAEVREINKKMHQVNEIYKVRFYSGLPTESVVSCCE